MDKKSNVRTSFYMVKKIPYRLFCKFPFQFFVEGNILEIFIIHNSIFYAPRLSNEAV